MKAFSNGTAACLKPLTETHTFEARATVVSSHAHLAMGLKIGEVLPNSREALQDWLPAVVLRTSGRKLAQEAGKSKFHLSLADCSRSLRNHA